MVRVGSPHRTGVGRKARVGVPSWNAYQADGPGVVLSQDMSQTDGVNGILWLDRSLADIPWGIVSRSDGPYDVLSLDMWWADGPDDVLWLDESLADVPW